jgi:peptidoglycan/xylan/chitin deacetylase (PgdA/CDA1 family)
VGTPPSRPATRTITVRAALSTKQLGALLVQKTLPRTAALRLARARNRSLVLVYHRIAPEGPAAHEVVRSMVPALFARQLQMLAELGDIVPLARLLEGPHAGPGPRFAITFDDDHPSHQRWALPVLNAQRLHATFFLSGRALRRLGPYWWSVIEQSIRARGLSHTCRLLGVEGSTPRELAYAVQGSALVEQIPHLLPPLDEQPMPAAEIRALADAGMTIGFHTMRHQVMTRLSGPALEAALVEGRTELAAAAGTRLDLLAYPHGLADPRVARAAEHAGFRAAFTTRARAIASDSDRFLLGRWDPGFLDGDDFAAAVALRLVLPATKPRAMDAR